jgi:hypothetical protein
LSLTESHDIIGVDKFIGFPHHDYTVLKTFYPNQFLGFSLIKPRQNEIKMMPMNSRGLITQNYNC